MDWIKIKDQTPGYFERVLFMSPSCDGHINIYFQYGVGFMWPNVSGFMDINDRKSFSFDDINTCFIPKYWLIIPKIEFIELNQLKLTRLQEAALTAFPSEIVSGFRVNPQINTYNDLYRNCLNYCKKRKIEPDYKFSAEMVIGVKRFDKPKDPGHPYDCYCLEKCVRSEPAR